MMQYICIDIGGTTIKYSIMQEDFQMCRQHNVPTQAWQGGQAVLQKVLEIIEVCSAYCQPAGICISTAGMVDCEQGSIVYANELMPQYTGTQIKAQVEQRFQLPCEVENDVNCAGLAEANYGAGKAAKTCVCLTVGTGIGGCILSNGRIFRGSGTAGAFGYLPMEDGRFEQYAAASVLTGRIAARKQLDEISGQEVFALYAQGDAVCVEEIERMTQYLARGIAAVCYVVAPDLVILGGGVMARFDLLREKIQAALDEYLIVDVRNNMQLVGAQFGNHAGMVGALCHFLQRRPA